MTERVLVDTSTWIMALRPGKSEVAARWLDEGLKTGTVVTLPTIKAELLAGAKTDKEFQELAEALEALPGLPVTDSEWHSAAEALFKLQRAGITVPMMDALSAVVAATNGCRLAHHDRHFAKLEAVVGCATLEMPPLPSPV